MRCPPFQCTCAALAHFVHTLVIVDVKSLGPTWITLGMTLFQNTHAHELIVSHPCMVPGSSYYPLKVNGLGVILVTFVMI